MEKKTDNEPRTRILIVEDEAILAEELRGRLQQIGHEVIGIVDNGPQAIEMARQARPDLVLMDIRLKGPMDGIEAAVRIYEELPIPIVYVTAHADRATMQRAMVAAQFGYVIKPFGERELMLAVDTAVRRHQVEKNLQEGHLTYATILSGVTDAVVATDNQGRVRFLNPVAESLTGWLIGEASGKPVEEVMQLVDPVTGNVVSGLLEPVLRGESIQDPDKMRRLKDRKGRWVTVEVSKSPVKDAVGKLIGAMVVLRDVTEHRRAEERFRNLLESAPDAMVIVDASEKIVLVNSQTEKMFGYLRGELIGNGVEMLIPERLRGKHQIHRGQQHEEHAWKLSAGTVMELCGRRKDGAEFPIEMNLAPLETAEGLLVSSTIRDITDRKRTEAELSQAHKMDAIGTLAGGIAHDFNNILAAIMGYVELARWDVDKPQIVRESLDEISKSANRAKSLVRQILTFTRQEPMNRVVLALGPIVEECVSLLRATIPAGVDLHLETQPDVPEILADATQIHQVLLNLCTNSWHALPEKDGRIVIGLESVEIAAEVSGRVPGLGKGRYARLSIQDNGHGMDEATQAKAFEPFFTTKSPGKGTGLGLSVVLGIVQSHKGIIDLHSEPGTGTVIHLYFPAVLSDKNVQPDSKPALPLGHGEWVLFIDDEKSLVRVAAATLNRLGYRPEVFDQADLALAVFAATPDKFAAVITDYNMPGLSGLAVARKVLEIRPNMAVILNSGFISEDLMNSAREIGIARILLKPNSTQDLAEALHEVCDRSSSGNQLSK